MTVVPHLVGDLDWRYTIQDDEQGVPKFDINNLVGQAETRLRELVTEYAPSGLVGGVTAKHGTIYQLIIKTADRLEIDLIVMTAHRPSLKDYLVGPNAARVSRHADCSVLILRDRGGPAKLRLS
jgi:nucleotide-binding universal stress UspA family protein